MVFNSAWGCVGEKTFSNYVTGKWIEDSEAMRKSFEKKPKCLFK